MHSELVEFLNQEVSGCNAVLNQAEVGDSSITVDATSIKACCFALRDSEKYEFNVLQVITGSDFGEELEVAYIIASFINNLELILKIRVLKGTELPKVDSVCDVWKSANYQERECYDMIGVDFVGHPELERILCPYDWEGYPLRKDYVVQKEYMGMEINPVHKVNQADHDFMTNLKLKMENPKLVSGSWKGHVTEELADQLEKKMESLKAAKATE